MIVMAVMLHQTVLVIPQGHQQHQAQRRILDEQIGSEDHQDRTDNETLAETAELVGGPVDPQPGDEVMGDGHPQGDGRQRSPGQVSLRREGENDRGVRTSDV